MVTQITLPDERWYHIEKTGKYLPSVTWILESFPKGYGFFRWLAEMPSMDAAMMARDNAGVIGSKTHNALADLLEGRKINFDDKYFNDERREFEKLGLREWECLLTFVNFWNENQPKLLEKDIIVYDEEGGFAGTLDAVLEINGEIHLIDFKTSSAIYDTYWMQVAAYRAAYPKPIHKTSILRLGTRHKKGYEFVSRTSEEYSVDLGHFFDVKKVHHIINPETQPRVKTVPESIQLTI